MCEEAKIRFKVIFQLKIDRFHVAGMCIGGPYIIEMDSLEQFFGIKNPITSSFDHFNFVIEAFDKSTAMTMVEIIEDVVIMIFWSCEKGIETSQLARFNVFHPAFYISICF